jgi:light-regulated signal transduction histidine kinase (bacteriophytochrome)
MTAKQKANRERFKKVVKEAAKLRKANKKLTQAQAVKQAWVIMKYKEGKNPINKIKNYVQKAKEDIKKGYYGDKYKPGKKKVAGTSTHKDTKSHNVNIRVVSGVKTKTTSKKQAVEIKKQLSKKGYKLVHGYKVARRKSIGALPMYRDQDAAREIELYADNDSQLYYQRRKPILVNLAKKYKKGTFDIDKAAKLWRYYIDAALQKYNKEFGSRGDKWSDLLSTHDRQLLALEYATRTKNEFDLGNMPE